MKCNYCKSACNKAGKQHNGVQKYRCISCLKYQQQIYVYKAYKTNMDERLIRCLKAGCGIRGIRSILEISCTTIISRIREIASCLESNYTGCRKTYEMDELYTFIGNKNKPCWIIYAIDRINGAIVNMKVGNRSRENVKEVVDSVLRFFPRKIYTDRLNIYPGLIDKSIHKAGRYLTNKIERFNLTLRTHLKRLNRSTICYSRKADMLESCLKIYFWS